MDALLVPPIAPIGNRRKAAQQWLQIHDVLEAHYPDLARFALKKAVELHNEAIRQECLEQYDERTKEVL